MLQNSNFQQPDMDGMNRPRSPPLPPSWPEVAFIILVPSFWVKKLLPRGDVLMTSALRGRRGLPFCAKEGELRVFGTDKGRGGQNVKILIGVICTPKGKQLHERYNMNLD